MTRISTTDLADAFGFPVTESLMDKIGQPADEKDKRARYWQQDRWEAIKQSMADYCLAATLPVAGAPKPERKSRKEKPVEAPAPAAAPAGDDFFDEPVAQAVEPAQAAEDDGFFDEPAAPAPAPAGDDFFE